MIRICTEWRTRAAQPVSGASAAIFRVLFGLMATAGALRFVAKGWVDSLYLAPEHHLTYAGFEWVRPLPAPFMHATLLLLGVLGLAIAVGWHYRLSVAAYALVFTYTELIDAALYLNHYWWVTTASLLMIASPLNRSWSLDRRAGRVRDRDAGVVPAGVVWALRAQVAVVYVFAGLAKLQDDWLFHAMPMQVWLADRTHLPLVGPLLDEPVAAYAASWAGAAFDCTIVGWLLWRRSRSFAYGAVVAFHTATALLFQIGMFPWLMIGGTLVFFGPGWPLHWVRRSGGENPALSAVSPIGRRTLLVVAVVVIAHVAIPLRHLVYAGDVAWTEEGYYGSWRVMLTEKDGVVDFAVRSPTTGQEWRVGPEEVLADWQVAPMSIRPDSIVATAHLIADEFATEGYRNVEVRAEAFASLNGDAHQRFIDGTIDLARQPRGATRGFVVPKEP